MMTLNLAKKIIHIDTTAAVAILFFAVSSTWAIRNYTDELHGLTKSQEQTNAVLHNMAKKDSIKDEHDKKVDQNFVAFGNVINGIRDTMKTFRPIRLRWTNEVNTPKGTRLVDAK
jgi:hypothetical protein